LGAVGLSAATALLAVMLVVALVLSPIWVPVLAIVGIIALVRRTPRRTA